MTIDLLEQLCSVPTAPFAESRVIQFIERFVERRPDLVLSRDKFGNRLIELPGDRNLPRLVFTAHMDHPGFVASRMTGPTTLEASFRGYVLADYFKGQPVCFFDSDREIQAVVASIGGHRAKRNVPTRVRLNVSGPVAPGSPGMWNLPGARRAGRYFYSRVCDDLAGAAAALQMLDMMIRRPSRSTVALLLTRAEEEGFIGAIAASLRPALLRKTDRLIAIECSAQQPYAPQGKGAIIRVGDRTSVFNSSLSYFLSRQAEALSKRDKTFRVQRALMPGGTCEATVYDAYGFTAASICIALGNYHNMDTAKQRIVPEFIDVQDWQNMVKLFVQLATKAHEYQPGHLDLKSRLEKRYLKLAPLLSP